jgi:8-oxo-dGTP pyrophosphatase MutT (NUDIX family)
VDAGTKGDELMPIPTLTTMPNAALPAGFRKKMPAGDERLSAAGIMFLAPDGKVLFVKRGGDGDHAGEWAFPAGRVEQDEEPADAARREALEKIGHLASWDLAPLHRETSPEGVDFSTFGQAVPALFDPILNEEHDEHVWAAPDEAPEPLHPGVAKLLAKFFQEEAAEPEHERSGAAARLEEIAGDWAAPEPSSDDAGALERQNAGLPPESGAMDGVIRVAFDESMRSFDEDGHMRVKVSNISKAQIRPYRGDEVPGWDEESKVHLLGLDPDETYMMFCPAEELAKSVKTWNGKPLLLIHKPSHADEHPVEETIGSVFNVDFADPYLRAALSVWTKEGIELIESEEQREISCGYHYDPIMEPGVFNGERYDGVMRNIRGNHVAIVEEGRAGPDVVVADSLIEHQWAVLEAALAETWP